MFAGIIYLIGGIISGLVGFRFLFQLLGANPVNDLVSSVYTWSTPLVRPFAGIFGQDATILSTQGTVTASVFDWTALIAFLVYGVVFTVISRFAGR